jgi:predicted ArsR family transcriptional regulator
MALRALPLAQLDLPLERDLFFRTMLRELSAALEDVIGLDQAEGFVSVVGQRVGDDINANYRVALGAPTLDAEQVAAVLVDLKQRLGGTFVIESQDDERIVLRNGQCPFGEQVLGRPALCMMTSNVFGSIVAENLGYARVRLEETIALGHGGCLVVVELHPSAEEGSLVGREYFAR